MSNVLVLWTDGDREGESIAHEIMEVCCCGWSPMLMVDVMKDLSAFV